MTRRKEETEAEILTLQEQVVESDKHLARHKRGVRFFELRIESLHSDISRLRGAGRQAESA